MVAGEDGLVSGGEVVESLEAPDKLECHVMKKSWQGGLSDLLLHMQQVRWL